VNTSSFCKSLLILGLIQITFPILLLGQNQKELINNIDCQELVLIPPIMDTISLSLFEKYEQFGIEIHVNQKFFLSTTSCLKITASHAVSLSINFGPGELNDADTLIVKSNDQLHKQFFPGKLWNRGNIFPATLPVYGDTIFLFCRSTQEVAIQIHSVVYGFKDWKTRFKGFGDSGPCNNNVNCGFDDWANEKRGVVMILTSGNTRKCSGSLINTTANDGRPYVLTARHCNVQPNNIFLFNYESTDCSQTDGHTHQIIQGCTILSQWAPSDFCLLELSEAPPPEYFPFYNGWSRNYYLASGTTCIHHPRGDVKKISFDNNPAWPASYIGSSDTARNHWHIQEWDSGTTEPVSSGSPLFDWNHQIIGQLHGGQASCNYNFNDYFGMIFYSWFGGGLASNSLQPWLDPLGLNPGSWTGLDPYTPIWNNDIGFIQKNLNIKTCDETPILKLKLRNFGFNPVVRLLILNHENSESRTVLDTLINLPYSKKFEFDVDIGFISKMQTRDLLFTCSKSPEPDENPSNDSLHIKIMRENGEKVLVSIYGDTYAGENEIYVFNSVGDTIDHIKVIPPFELMTKEYCLPFGCYNLLVLDEGNDGMCCNYGAGFVEVYDSRNNNLGKVDQFFGSAEISFCVPYQIPLLGPLVIFPNPVHDFLNITISPDILEKMKNWYILTIDSRIMAQGQSAKYLTTFDVDAWPHGVYTYVVQGDDFTYSKKFIKVNR